MYQTQNLLLAAALTGLLAEASYELRADATVIADFRTVTADASEALSQTRDGSDATLGASLTLAAGLRGLIRHFSEVSEWDGVLTARFQQAMKAARVALAEFDQAPLILHAHYETAIERDSEQFEVVALTSHSPAEYENTCSPGDILAYISTEGLAGPEFARRAVRQLAQPYYGDGHQVGNALRASKALIEALLKGDRRSEGDLRDVLSNFDGLTA